MTVFVFRRTHLQLERVAHHPFVPTLVEVHPLDLDKHPRNVARRGQRERELPLYYRQRELPEGGLRSGVSGLIERDSHRMM